MAENKWKLFGVIHTGNGHYRVYGDGRNVEVTNDRDALFVDSAGGGEFVVCDRIDGHDGRGEEETYQLDPNVCEITGKPRWRGMVGMVQSMLGLHRN